MVEIKTKRISDGEIECTTKMEGTGEDLILEAYYAISGIVKGLGDESYGLKVMLMKALAENNEWMHERKEATLGDILGRMAKERSFN